jgi:hypothetical protein
MVKEQALSKNCKLYILDLLTRVTIVIVMVSFILYLVVIPESFAFFTYSTVSPAFIVEIKAPAENKLEEQSEVLAEGKSDANMNLENDIPAVDEEIVDEEVEDYEDTTIRQ